MSALDVCGWLLLAAFLVLELLGERGRCDECGGRGGWHDDECASWWRR